MNRRALVITAAGLILPVLWLAAQAVRPNTSLSSMFPGGAILLVETKNLSGLLADWSVSDERKLWLSSANASVFSNTTLALRLQQAQESFENAAGFAPGMSFAESVAGGQSALAIYDIGNLEFLYATRIELPAATKSALFQNRSSYETRKSGNHDYSVRSAGARTVAFAYADGVLLIATRENLLAGALALMTSGASGQGLHAEAWYQDAVRGSPAAGDVRMALNISGLLKSPYYRSYWLHRNATEMKQFSSGLVDLRREPTGFREERSFLRLDPAAAAQTKQAAVKELAGIVPAGEGLYRCWSVASADQVVQLVREKILAPGPQTSAYLDEPARPADPDALTGSPADLETRIDQPPLQVTQTSNAVAEIARALAGHELQAVLHVQSSRRGADPVFIGNETAIAVLSDREWPAVNVAGAYVHRAGKLLIIADRQAILARLVAQTGKPAASQAGSYVAVYNHRRELDPFVQMMRLIEGSPAAEATAEGEPAFFSQSIASLGQTLKRLASVSVVARDEGSRVRQEVTYRLQ